MADADLQTRFGVIIRTCRRKLGITQEELAWRAGLHRTYVADIERGARNVTLRSVAHLAKALEVTAGNLLSFVTATDGTVSRGGGQPGANPAGEILLVEDSAADAAMTTRAFKRAKIANPLRIVRDAESGLDCLFGTGRSGKRLRPQLILLDLNLPQMPGIEFLRRVKGDERTRDIPIVVLTVSQSDRMIIECGRLGAENYIVKPVGIESFLKVTPRLNLQLTVVAAAGRRW